jgi:hypothetical protein
MLNDAIKLSVNVTSTLLIDVLISVTLKPYARCISIGLGVYADLWFRVWEGRKLAHTMEYRYKVQSDMQVVAIT